MLTPDQERLGVLAVRFINATSDEGYVSALRDLVAIGREMGNAWAVDIASNALASGELSLAGHEASAAGDNEGAALLYGAAHSMAMRVPDDCRPVDLIRAIATNEQRKPACVSWPGGDA
jgi:hypothetical protein